MGSHLFVGCVKNENLKHRFGCEREERKLIVLGESTVTEEKKNRKLLTFRFYT